MNQLRALYLNSLSLLTDLYQLTMAYSYWQAGLHQQQAVFHLFFRRAPFQSGFTLAAGLDAVQDYLQDFHFSEADAAYLETLQGNDGKQLFSSAFIEYLRNLRLTCEVAAVREGSVVFAHQPLVRVSGDLLQCQLLETPLLNLVNFPTLIATKAARVCLAAQGDAVLEFGLRRAQGIDGGVTASRAAYIGGCAATSNVLAGQLYDIPVRGTHAHSWVMSFSEELEAFQTYAHAMPNNCVFLVDTYDTLAGVKNAIEAGRWLREQGHKMAGIRLDSGDLAKLSQEARQLLDAAGFADASIVGSSDLDEYRIAELKQQGAQIRVWGVGTKLATAYDQPALGGVYKLGAIRSGAGADWHYRVKLSNDAIKVSNPGMLQTRRYYQADKPVGDMLWNQLAVAPDAQAQQVRLQAGAQPQALPPHTHFADLLQPLMQEGAMLGEKPNVHEIRAYAQAQLALFGASLAAMPDYPVSLEKRLYELKMALLAKAAEASCG